MLIKRIYKKPDGWERKVDENGNCTNPPPLDYIALAHTGTDPEQNFSTRAVAAAVQEGWMKLVGDKLTLVVHPEPLVYKIVRTPGRYCLHCSAKLPDDPLGVFARAHIAQEHAGVASPDPTNPAGYVAINAYQCVLDSAQHEKYKKPPPGRAPHFHVKGG